MRRLALLSTLAAISTTLGAQELKIPTRLYCEPVEMITLVMGALKIEEAKRFADRHYFDLNLDSKQRTSFRHEVGSPPRKHDSVVEEVTHRRSGQLPYTIVRTEHGLINIAFTPSSMGAMELTYMEFVGGPFPVSFRGTCSEN